MEDEDIAPNAYSTADPEGMGRKSCLYTIFQYCEQTWLTAHTDWISCMYVLGAKASSSILYPHLP